MGIHWTQDPEETLDYTLDWSLMLVPGDVVSRAHFTVTGMDVLSENWNDTLTTVWLLGGSVGSPPLKYTVTCHMSTAEGREYERSFKIYTKEK